MFNSKKQTLFETKQTQKTSAAKSPFITKGLKAQAVTTSGNNAKKFANTDNEFVNDFSNLGAYKEPRSYNSIQTTMSTLWDISNIYAIQLAMYARLITRKIWFFDGNKTNDIQKGQGLKNEGIFRMMWIAINYPNSFWKNVELFISAGSWKDIIMMLSYDLQYHGWSNRQLNWSNFGKLILAGLENPTQRELLKKYLPQIKSNNNCKTIESQADNIIAKWICSLLFGGKANDNNYKNYKHYRKLKSSGTAHEWQQLISQGKHNLVDFDTIHGRALSKLVSGKYLFNQGLSEKYQKWIETKPVAKFTGYVYELAMNIKRDNKKYQNDTINSQYNMLLKNVGENHSDFIVVKDTSGSMDHIAHGTKMSSYHIAKSLSIYFGNLLQGYFHNHYIDFSSSAILRSIKGSNFVEHWNTEERIQSANTNFLAVAKLFVGLKAQGVSEKDFPKGILLISDGEFDSNNMNGDTNIKNFRIILKQGGFSKIFRDELTFVFWDIRNSFYRYGNVNRKFETYNSEKYKVFYFSGYDGSVISFLTGSKNKENAPRNAKELFEEAMNQKILQKVEV
jgi:hypothetical protein